MRKRIEAKVAELQKELQRWAEEQEVIKRGEQIVLSFNIEGAPSLIQDMSMDDFFSVNRLVSFGVAHPLAVRISKYIGYYEQYWDHSTSPPTDTRLHNSVGEFIAQPDPINTFFRIPNLGRKCIKEVIRVLRESGFNLEGPKWESPRL